MTPYVANTNIDIAIRANHDFTANVIIFARRYRIR
jgi:hypothetical protein